MGVGDLGTWVTIGDLVACVEPSRRRQRGRRQHLRDLLLELHAPDLVALGRVLAVPRAVLVGDALLDLERGPGRVLSQLDGFTRGRSTKTTAPRSTISARPWRRSRKRNGPRGECSVARIRSQRGLRQPCDERE